MKSPLDDAAAMATLLLAVVTMLAIGIPIFTASLDRRRRRKARLREIAIFLRLLKEALIWHSGGIEGGVPYMGSYHICRRLLNFDATTPIETSLAKEVYSVAAKAWGVIHLTARTRETFNAELAAWEREDAECKRAGVKNPKGYTLELLIDGDKRSIEQTRKAMSGLCQWIDEVLPAVERLY